MADLTVQCGLNKRAFLQFASIIMGFSLTWMGFPSLVAILSSDMNSGVKRVTIGFSLYLKGGASFVIKVSQFDCTYFST